MADSAGFWDARQRSTGGRVMDGTIPSDGLGGQAVTSNPTGELFRQPAPRAAPPCLRDCLLHSPLSAQHSGRARDGSSRRAGRDTRHRVNLVATLLATILMAMVQMEWEITSQRTSEAMADRAERGLWYRGQLLGYDLDPERPGYLVPNSVEELLVCPTKHTRNWALSRRQPTP